MALLRVGVVGALLRVGVVGPGTRGRGRRCPHAPRADAGQGCTTVASYSLSRLEGSWGEAGPDPCSGWVLEGP